MQTTLKTILTFASLRQRVETEEWPAIRSKILARLDARGIPIEMLQFVERRVRFVAPAEHFDAIRTIAEEFDLAWRAVPRCVKLSVVGPGVHGTAGMFYRSAEALREAGITLLHFTDSETSISLLVQQQDVFRAESILRRIFVTADAAAATRSMHFDPDLGRVRVNGIEKRLGVRQLKLLAFLLENAGQIVKAEEVAEHLFGSSEKDDLTTLRVHVHNLRKKIEHDPNEPRYLMTIPNRGYLFVA